MNTQEKYKAITNAYTITKRGEEDIQIIKSNTAPEVKDKLLDIQRELNVGFDLSYEIVSDAAACVSDISIEVLPDENFYETECASIYTATRLEYMNGYNQEEITEIIKEYSTDIQTAYAIWYDQKVAEACRELKDYILEE